MSQLNPVEATITQKSGVVYVERDGERLSLEIGDSIYEADLIITGPETTAEIVYMDGTKSRLAPETQMRLVDFEYDASMSGENSFLVDIVEGAMRTVTGEIVKLNPDAFEIVTPRATVGIRGTDITTQLNEDGSETHVVISIGQGHRVEITTHNGQMVSLHTANQGAFIPVDLASDMKPYLLNFSQEEIDEIIKHINGALSDEQFIEEELDEQDHSSVTIDQSTIDILGSEVVEALTNSLESAGIEVILPEALTLETNENDTTLVPGEPDGPVIDEFGFTVIDFNPQSSFYADSDDVNVGAGNTYTATKTRLNITAPIDSDIVISGDVNTVTSGTVQAADDIITGSDMSNGRVVGDASSVASGATLIAGNDEITFDSKTGGTSIYGDAHTIAANATATFANDTITIKGNFANSTISGDAFNVDPLANITKWGNDHIIIENNMSDPSAATQIHGDDADANRTLGGNDTIEIRGTFNASDGQSYINAGGGNDSIFINNYQAGTLFTGYGDDTVTINTHNSVVINNINGTDTVYFTNDIDGTKVELLGAFNIQKSPGVDVSIKSGELHLSDAADSININELNGVLNTYGGNDTIKVTNYTSGNIIAGDGNDKLYLDTVNTNMTLNGGGGTDTIYIQKGGNHNLTAVTGFESYNFSDENNTITVKNLNASLGLGSGTNSIYVQDAVNHTFTNVGSNDTYYLSNNADTITIKYPSSISPGIIDTRGGADVVSIDFEASNLPNVYLANSGSDYDTITFVNKTVNTSSRVTLSGSGGFEMTTFNEDYIDLRLEDTKLKINNFNNGAIFTNNASSGDNWISITTMNNNSQTTIGFEGSGDDTINITNLGTTGTYIPSINTGRGEDLVAISDMNKGEIFTEGGNDTINVGGTANETFGSGTIDAGEGNDSIGILSTNSADTLTIKGGTGADLIQFGTMYGVIDYEIRVDLGDDTDADILTLANGNSTNGTKVELYIDNYKAGDQVSLFGNTIDASNDGTTYSDAGLTVTVHFI